MIDYTILRLHVKSWAQTVMHGEKYPTHQFSCIARTSDDEDLRLTGGPSIRTLDFHMSLIRGSYVPSNKERPLERGIGILAFAEERDAQDDIPSSNAFCHGWWWMPEALYDEAWSQVKANTFQDSSIELDIAPIDYGQLRLHWDPKKNKVIYVLRAGIRFERKPEPPPRLEPPKRRGWFG